jgi:hypothetical protein
MNWKWYLSFLACLTFIGFGALRAETELAVIPDNVDLTGPGWVEACVPDCNPHDTNAGEAKLRFFCDPSHLAYDDPIINPGQPGAAHLHHFFGNETARANSTYTSLRTTGTGTCQGGPANRTGYWMPAMINGRTGKVVKPRSMELYYRAAPGDRYLTETIPGQFTSANCPPPPAIACPTYATRDIPKGLRAIFGWNFVTNRIDPGPNNALTGQTYWSCISPISGQAGAGGTLKQVFYDANTPSNGLNACVNSGTGSTLGAGDYSIMAVVATNSCWSGQIDSEDHRSHVTNTISDQISRQVCPTTHPYLIPNLSLIVSWDFDTNSDDFKDWYLSSDRHNGATWRAGETMHADFFWAWSPVVMQQIVETIWNLDGGDYVTCSLGCLGNNTRLNSNGINTFAYIPLASRYLDIPQRGSKGRIRSRVR